MIILPNILSSLIIDETLKFLGSGGEKADPYIFCRFSMGGGAWSREAVAARKLGGCEASCERRRDACSAHQCFKCIEGMSMIALLQFPKKSDSKVDILIYD